MNRKVFNSFIIIIFIAQQIFSSPGLSHAQGAAQLPEPGTMILPSSDFTPVIMNGMVIDVKDPFHFDFIFDRSDENLKGESFQKEAQKGIRYFMTSLTVPDDEMWVNLSPYEKDRIIANGLGETEMGRDMLVQDYLLKQLTASLMYPDEGLGGEFWDKVYKKSQALFGTTDIPTNTFNKIWIVPKEASVYVNDNKVFVLDSHLSVMLEQDYLALKMNQGSVKHGIGDVPKSKLDVLSEEAKKAVKEVLIPIIEKEVNNGKTFSNLRQIYNSMILATWYKQHLRKSSFGQLYVDRNRTDGVDVEDKQVKDKIYEQYLSAFKKGVFDFIREDFDPVTQQIIPRKYFSGGLEKVEKVVNAQPSEKWIDQNNKRDKVIVSTDMVRIGGQTVKALSKLGIVALLLSSLCSGGCSIAEKHSYKKQIQSALKGTTFQGQSITQKDLLPAALKVLSSPKVPETAKAEIKKVIYDDFKGMGQGIHLLNKGFERDKPTVLLIHGATGEGGTSSFVDQLPDLYDKVNVVTFQYDHFESLEKNAAQLNREFRTFKYDYNVSDEAGLIVEAYCFGNIIFRRAALSEKTGIFKKAQVVEVAPLHGGSPWTEFYFDTPVEEWITDKLGVKEVTKAVALNGPIQNGLYSPKGQEMFLNAISGKVAFVVPGDSRNPAPGEDGRENFERGLEGGPVENLEGSTHADAPSAPAVIKKIDEMIRDLSIKKQGKKEPGNDNTKADVGGIDFNPKALDLKVQGTALSFTLPSLSQEEIQNIDFTGYLPDITSVRPVTDFLILIEE